MSPVRARAGAGRSTQVRGEAGAEAGPRLGAGGPPPLLCSPRPPAPAPGGEPRVAAAVAEPAQPGAWWQLRGASRNPAQPGRAEETLSRSPALAVPLGPPDPRVRASAPRAQSRGCGGPAPWKVLGERTLRPRLRSPSPGVPQARGHRAGGAGVPPLPPPGSAPRGPGAKFLGKPTLRVANGSYLPKTV